jgi:hypothetical protein
MFTTGTAALSKAWAPTPAATDRFTRFAHQPTHVNLQIIGAGKREVAVLSRRGLSCQEGYRCLVHDEALGQMLQIVETALEKVFPDDVDSGGHGA